MHSVHLREEGIGMGGDGEGVGAGGREGKGGIHALKRSTFECRQRTDRHEDRPT